MERIYNTKTECCGCSACAQICPVGCIEMKEDKDGFIFPVIDKSRCINCGKCKTVCLYHNDNVLNHPRSCYAYLHPDAKHREQSSSSGLFETICRSFEEDSDLYIWGSQMTKELKVKHCGIKGFDNIDIFKKSKYLQSRITNDFKEIRQKLKENQKVVFSGTPCQNAALKSFLGKDYPNLLLVDFVCHGVPNQKIFDRYLEYLGDKNKSEIVNYTFRHKRYTDTAWNNLSINYMLKNGKIANVFSWEDLYMKGFLSGLYNRDACYSCKFARTERVSDITMGDFWGIDKLYPEWSETITNGTSLLLSNTEKGEAIVDGIEKNCLKVFTVADATRENQQLVTPSLPHIGRTEFFKAFRRGKSFEKCFEAAFPKNNNSVATKIYNCKAYQLLSYIKQTVISKIKK